MQPKILKDPKISSHNDYAVPQFSKIKIIDIVIIFGQV